MNKHELLEIDLDRCQEALNLRFRDPSLLEQALTHRSLVNELPELNLADNQRLEFLGDAILDFIVGEWLFRRYPLAREGELTSLRAHVVRTEGLAGFARQVGLGQWLRLGRGEGASGGQIRPANLCAAFEALVGALYLDQGLAAVRAWFEPLLERHAQSIDEQYTDKDAKSCLQEFTQGTLRVTPSYRIIGEEGPDHAKVFTAQALVADEVWGEGAGTTKQAAEQAAAQDALERHRPRDRRP